jgi:transcriptional regulator with XRE-family HTH domain
VGARIAELRVSRGWTQEQFAERLGVATRYVQSVEGGDENLTIETMAKLANNLRVRVATLFADGDEEKARASGDHA